MAVDNDGNEQPQVVCAEAERRMMPSFLTSLTSPYSSEDLIASDLFVCDPEVCEGRIPGMKLFSILGHEFSLRDTCPALERFSETIVDIDGML